MAIQQPYAEQWRDYRKRRRIFLVVCITYLPGVFILAYPLIRLVGSDHPVYIIAGTWMLGFLIAGLRFSHWRCPRCGNWFFAKWWFVNQFARKCVHCQLPKWALD